MSHPRRTLRALALLVRLLGRFLVDVVRSSLVQARLVLRPSLEVHVQWIGFRTRLQTPAARTALGVLISMTPGTLTCGFDGDLLTIHALSDRRQPDVADEISQRFETLLLEMEALR